MKKLLAVGTLTLAFGAGSMFAGQFTQTFSIAPTTTDIVVSPASTETFNFFQSTSGWNAADILDSVTLSVSVNQTVATLTIHNTTASSATFTFRTTGGYDVGGTAPDQGALDAAISALNTTLFFSGNQTLAAGTTYTAPNGAAPSGIGSPVTSSTGVITAANTSAYNTTGTFTLDFSTLTGETIGGGGGNVVATETSNAGAAFSVVYDYTVNSTPEPATMTLFGSALLGIGFFARKRFKKS
jgi:PEP-CTERM motif